MLKYFAVLVLLLAPALAGMPSQYYNNHERINATPEYIYMELEKINYSPLYIEDEFDCTEVTAHCEYRLENLGIDANIVVSDYIPHCFIQALTTEGWMMIEVCTESGQIVPIRDRADWHYREENNTIFRNIYEMVSLDYGSVNWWDSLEC